MKWIAPVLAALLCACVTNQSSSPKPRPRPSRAKKPSQPAAYAVVNGDPISHGDLSVVGQQRIAEIENELKQRQLHALWVGVEEAIDQKLLSKEAAKRDMSLADLRKAEVDDRVTTPTDEDVQAFYEANQSLISVPFEQVAGTLKAKLRERQEEELEALLIERLRDQVEIRYDLPVPELPRVEMDLEGQPSIGSEKAVVTLVEFSDFECPYCARGRKLIDKLRELYPEQLRVVYRDFPLRQHAHARPAAEAAQCAHEQKKFWPYHDKLFDNADALTTEDLRRYAEEVGLDLDAYDKCIASDSTKDAVALDEKDGAVAGVDGTPSLFVNGIKLVGLLPIPLMRAIIDSELQR